LQSLKKPPIILEIGSGYGLLVDYIQKKILVEKYFHLEMNLSLKNELKSRGQLNLDSVDKLAYTDVVIMSHVLEHIQDGKKFLEDLVSRYPHAQIILYQTNYKGIIPKYFPLIWYGWFLDQHYYHFTPKSLGVFF